MGQIDINTINNSKLVDSIIALKKTNGIKEEYVFAEELEQGIFLLPIKKQNDYQIISSKVDSDDGTPINFLLIEQPSGKFLPAFTTLQELKTNIKDCDVIPLTYEHLVDLIINNEGLDGFYIDPYTLGIQISEDSIWYFKSIKENSLFNAKSIKFGEPYDYPRPLLTAIIGYLKEHNNIKEAYFRLMQIDDNLPQFLVILNGDYEEKSVYDAIHKRTHHMLYPGVILNITSIDSYIGKQALDEKVTPFYKYEEN